MSTHWDQSPLYRTVQSTSDGKVERTVKTIKDTVVKLLHGAVALWPLYIPFVQLVFNNKVQELTGSTPFSLMFGRR